MSVLGAILGAAGISGAFGLGSSLINNQYQSDFNDKQIELAKWQNNQNISNQWKMWNATNAYNTPAAQMRRYEAAGLNPNLIYGQTNEASPITLPSQTTPQGQKAPQLDLGDFVKSLEQIPMYKAQLDNMKLNNEAQQLTNNILAEKGMQESYNTVWSRENLYKMQFLEDGRMDGYLNAWYNGLMSDTAGKQEKVYLIRAQKDLTNLQNQLRTLEKKYLTGEGYLGGKGFYEMKLDSMRIANEMSEIEKSWLEVEKALGAGSNFSRVLMSLWRSMSRGK